MRKVFVFWSIILLILLLGVGAIIYGRVLLGKEEKNTDQIRRELTLPRVPRALRLPTLPTELEIEKTSADVKLPESPPPPEVESLKMPGGTEVPTPPEDEALPSLPLRTPEAPILPEPPRPAVDIEPLKAPELPLIPKLPPQ